MITVPERFSSRAACLVEAVVEKHLFLHVEATAKHVGVQFRAGIFSVLLSACSHIVGLF
jgi:hypothetical protein